MTGRIGCLNIVTRDYEQDNGGNRNRRNKDYERPTANKGPKEILHGNKQMNFRYFTEGKHQTSEDNVKMYCSDIGIVKIGSHQNFLQSRAQDI